MLIIDDWLEDKISDRRFQHEPAVETDEFAMFAGMLRAEALASGYTLDALEYACGGDISSYVAEKMRLQSSRTAQVARLPSAEAAYA